MTEASSLDATVGVEEDHESRIQDLADSYTAGRPTPMGLMEARDVARVLRSRGDTVTGVLP